MLRTVRLLLLAGLLGCSQEMPPYPSVPDSGVSVTDGGIPGDAASPVVDAAVDDGGQSDAGDAGVPDADLLDAGVPDADLPDADLPDA
jgi:hypothetical protein